MNSICGIVDSSLALPGELERMLEALAPRGGEPARFNDGAVALGARVISPAAGVLSSTDGRSLTVAGDVRLDNREALVATLGLDTRPADLEIVLAAYGRWGSDCPERLYGDFAFAIWDPRARTLFCARDRRGVKQLYYHRSRTGLAFASEPRALLRVTGVPRALNRARVADHLLDVMEDPEATLFEGILRLPPANSITVDEGGARLRCYWALDPSRELQLASSREYEQAYLDALTEAVRCRLAEDGTTGSFLSGGLDSSSIAAIARNELGRQGLGALHTFSAVYDLVPECDERPYISAVVNGGGIEPHEVRAELLSPLTVADRWLTADDEPFRSPGLPVQAAVYEAAAGTGISVLLDGEGGDDVVSHGFGRLSELAASGHWLRLLNESRRLAPPFRHSTAGLLRTWAVKPLLPAGWLRQVRRARGRWWPEAALPVPINPDFAAASGLWERVEELSGQERLPRSAREEQFRALSSGLIGYNLGITERLASRFGVEPRYPFHDHRLAELGLSLPSDQKLDDGWTRVVARRALEGTLPDAVRLRRDKSTLVPSLAYHLLGPDRPMLEAMAFGSPGAIAEFVDIDAFQLLFRRYQEQRRPIDGTCVWLVANMARWLELPRSAASTASQSTTPMLT